MSKRLLALFIALINFAMAVALPPESKSCDVINVAGIVKDAKGKKPLALCDVTLNGTNIGTVTNADGRFSLTIPDTIKSTYIVVSKLGFNNAVVDISKSVKDLTIMLARSSNVLDEIVVYSGDPRRIVETALRKIPENYPRTSDMLSVFYRETIQKGKKYTEVSEAFIDVVKSPYSHRTPGRDKTHVLKGRKLMSQKSSDTIAVKILGGPNLALILDFVKNDDFFLDENELDIYEFTMADRVFFDGRQQYAINFEPKHRMHYALMKGTLYIDARTLAFSRAEFEMDMSDRELVVKSILRKKPTGLRFNPQKISFTISYRQGDDGLSYLYYIQNVMKFKCDWKRRLFSSTFTAVAELAVVDRDEATQTKINRQEAFRSRDAFSDVVSLYWDADFWKGYNIIEPTEKLENAVEKLKKNSISDKK